MDARYVWEGLTGDNTPVNGTIELRSDKPVVLDAENARTIDRQMSQMCGQRIRVLALTLTH